MFSPLTQRRWRQFRSNRRAFWSLILFSIIFVFSLLANVFCNDKPLFMRVDGKSYFPTLFYYSEAHFGFGNQNDIAPNYREKEFQEFLVHKKAFTVWPPVHYSYDTVNEDPGGPVPSHPTRENILGTDDQGRDVFARLVYGMRTSLVFGILLALLGSGIGILAGGIQGYKGGMVDLLFQRFIEIWSGLPVLFLLMVFSSLVQPTLWWLLFIMTLFSWTTLVGVVRAEFLRARQYTYVRAAQVMGVGSFSIMRRHIFPNAMVSTLTYLPFLVNQSISMLTSLDFLGFGLPLGTASLGEMLQQAKANLYAPWLGLTAFLAIAFVLILVTLIGEGLRDAFDPHRTTI